MFRRRQPVVHMNRLFAGCSPQELRAIARLGMAVRVERGRTLIRRGETGREFFVILDGNAHCDVGGRQVARYRPGDFFGETALLDGGPRTATVVTESAMDLLVFTPAEFRSLLETSGTVSYRVMAELAARLRGLDAA